ncbi:prolyl oligopeptidase family serine peptidase, partial [Candidatus Hydrogenedentota bacterium]
REEGPELFGADPDRIGVEGGSAGGYLTLMTGICLEPRPKALASMFGYGDITGDWYSKPDPFYCKQPMVSKEDAYSAVNKGVISGSHNKTHPFRGRFYLYCRQNGLWPKEVSGWDPITEREKFKPYSPVENVTAEYPPTILSHGDNDTDVPCELSILMAAELKRAGVTHELIILEGKGHGFKGATHEEMVSKVVDKNLAFLVRHVKNAKDSEK